MELDPIKIRSVKGFLDAEEAIRLRDLALEACAYGPCLEIGSYCGKSAVYLGSACKQKHSVLFSVDHHLGSEEQQPGQEYFDPELFDASIGRIDTLKFFRQTLSNFDLEDAVVPVIGRSETVGKVWQTPLGLLFIDGSHAYETALKDYEVWAKHLLPDGYLIFHDIFPNPADGGQAPYRVYQQAISSGRYDAFSLFKSLGVLRVRNNSHA